MSYLKNCIEDVNKGGRKALSVFLTAGFPDVDRFTDLAKSVLDAGADMIELGIPFSDPLADGSVIQHSSHEAIKNGVNIKLVLKFAEDISEFSSKPIILMGYANPILNYGMKNFFSDALNAGVKGVIVPDVPVEEYDDFFKEKPQALDSILLAAPTSGEERIKEIDKKSRGFVYCVSMTGTTGSEKTDSSFQRIKEIHTLVKKNKMMIGFGISKPDDIKNYSPYCDGVIVGSAVIKKLSSDDKTGTIKLIKDLSKACQ